MNKIYLYSCLVLCCLVAAVPHTSFAEGGKWVDLSGYWLKWNPDGSKKRNITCEALLIEKALLVNNSGTARSQLSAGEVSVFADAVAASTTSGYDLYLGLLQKANAFEGQGKKSKAAELRAAARDLRENNLNRWVSPLAMKYADQVFIDSNGVFRGLRFLEARKFRAFVKAGGGDLFGESGYDMLDLHQSGVKDADVKVLRKWRSLAHLDLSRNGLSWKGVKTVAQIPSLTHLDWSWNSAGVPGCRALAAHKSLRVLLLAYNSLSSEAIIELADTESILRLDLSNNQARINSAAFQALARNNVIQVLDISHNFAFNPNAFTYFATNTALTHLAINLEYSETALDDAREILKSRTIAFLDYSTRSWISKQRRLPKGSAARYQEFSTYRMFDVFEL